jgi:hypothetical protein
MILAACVHPDKKCFAIQVSNNCLVLLFLKDKSAEEVKLTFSKAKKIHSFSFLTGEQFNFCVATNISIDLYKVTTQKQSAKLVHSIPVTSKNPQFFIDVVANTIVVCDNKGFCQPVFLNLF